MTSTKSATEADLTAVRLANERFYRAVTDLDIQALSDAWSHDEDVRCIHPGWEVIEGWEAVRQSWHVIFSHTERLVIEPSEVKVRLEGEMAWVCCLESITSGPEEGITLARATNLFVRTASGWAMILHHASQVPPEARGEPQGEEDDDGETTVH